MSEETTKDRASEILDTMKRIYGKNSVSITLRHNGFFYMAKRNSKGDLTRLSPFVDKDGILWNVLPIKTPD